jgi:hypothetical protein
MRIKGVVLEHHRAAALARFQLVDHLPAMAISPLVISSSPAIRRSRVDLPQPEGPRMTTNSPLWMSRLTRHA